MRKQIWGAAVAATMAAAPAGAVHTERYQIPYFGLAADALITDSNRRAGEGEGFQVVFGVPLDEANQAVELRFFDSGYERDIDGKKDYQTGLFVDYVHDFGALGRGGPVAAVKPFVTLGVGFVEEDVRADQHLHLGFSAGAGVLVPIPFKGWAVRFDARVQPQSNGESCSDTSPCAEEADYLVDYRINLGLQIPLTLFFDRPVDMGAPSECPVAVVDPETGRRDCPTDSDRDGVMDSQDECPASPQGTSVDRRGCPRVRVTNDDDRDGVRNDQDDCPGTPDGLRVDEDGCVIAQKTSLSRVTFQPNSARLTNEGREVLDGVAETLRQQEDLLVEIAGHTDAAGSEAYNTLLSQQRAEAVRAYLVEKGVEERRLSAVGYGELEPVASNDTDEGRRRNRRVEFRISED